MKAHESMAVCRPGPALGVGTESKRGLTAVLRDPDAPKTGYRMIRNNITLSSACTSCIIYPPIPHSIHPRPLMLVALNPEPCTEALNHYLDSWDL